MKAENISFSFLNPKLSTSSTVSWSSTDVYRFIYCSYVGRVIHWLSYQRGLMDPIRQTIGIAPLFTHWHNGKFSLLGQKVIQGSFFHNIKALNCLTCEGLLHTKNVIFKRIYICEPLSISNTVSTGLSLKELEQIDEKMAGELLKVTK